jgi:sugar O-acyltransferase (sialic acid O-acetyltransferase NeuD family)
MNRWMSDEVVLAGCGGHGRVVLDTLLASGERVAGLFDLRLRVGQMIFGVEAKGGDEQLRQLQPNRVRIAIGVGANPSLDARIRLYHELTARGFSFCPVRHPSALIGAECEVAPSAQIMAASVLQNRVRVGENAVINTRASIDHDCVIGSHSFIAPGAVLSGGVRLGEAVFIGAGAVLVPGIEIGRNAVIGAGAVVIDNVAEGWVVARNPAVRIGTRTP